MRSPWKFSRTLWSKDKDYNSVGTKVNSGAGMSIVSKPLDQDLASVINPAAEPCNGVAKRGRIQSSSIKLASHTRCHSQLGALTLPRPVHKSGWICANRISSWWTLSEHLYCNAYSTVTHFTPAVDTSCRESVSKCVTDICVAVESLRTDVFYSSIVNRTVGVFCSVVSLVGGSIRRTTAVSSGLYTVQPAYVSRLQCWV